MMRKEKGRKEWLIGALTERKPGTATTGCCRGEGNPKTKTCHEHDEADINGQHIFHETQPAQQQ